jgi:hypothetical protein
MNMSGSDFEPGISRARSKEKTNQGGGKSSAARTPMKKFGADGRTGNSTGGGGINRATQRGRR